MDGGVVVWLVVAGEPLASGVAELGVCGLLQLVKAIRVAAAPVIDKKRTDDIVKNI